MNRPLLLVTILASCRGGAVPGDAGDGEPTGGGVEVLFRADAAADVEELYLSVERVEAEADFGEDDRLRDETWRLVLEEDGGA